MHLNFDRCPGPTCYPPAAERWRSFLAKAGRDPTRFGGWGPSATEEFRLLTGSGHDTHLLQENIALHYPRNLHNAVGQMGGSKEALYGPWRMDEAAA